MFKRFFQKLFGALTLREAPTPVRPVVHKPEPRVEVVPLPTMTSSSKPIAPVVKTSHTPSVTTPTLTKRATSNRPIHVDKSVRIIACGKKGEPKLISYESRLGIRRTADVVGIGDKEIFLRTVLPRDNHRRPTFSRPYDKVLYFCLG